jgi:microcystin-dependent protein
MPNTTNKGLITPNTGDLVGAWGTSAMNPNFGYLDGLLGGVASIALSSATNLVLSANSASITPAAGPFQQNNAMFNLSGTLTGTAALRLTQPGFYIVFNRCVVGAYCVGFAPIGGGNAIGIPPGIKSWIFFDGTDVDFVNPPYPGTALDLHGATAIPAWMGACTVPPYLIKDGTIYSSSTFPALAAILGSTFGGNGITTFAVPDERARARIALDPGGTGRLTAAVCGFNGTQMGAAGGDQRLTGHTHTDAGHTHNLTYNAISNAYNAQSGTLHVITQLTGADPFTETTAIGTASIATTGAGASQNVQPSIVSFLPLIKT